MGVVWGVEEAGHADQDGDGDRGAETGASHGQSVGQRDDPFCAPDGVLHHVRGTK